MSAGRLTPFPPGSNPIRFRPRVSADSKIRAPWRASVASTPPPGKLPPPPAGSPGHHHLAVDQQARGSLPARRKEWGGDARKERGNGQSAPHPCVLDQEGSRKFRPLQKGGAFSKICQDSSHGPFPVVVLEPVRQLKSRRQLRTRCRWRGAFGGGTRCRGNWGGCRTRQRRPRRRRFRCFFARGSGRGRGLRGFGRRLRNTRDRRGCYALRGSGELTRRNRRWRLRG